MEFRYKIKVLSHLRYIVFTKPWKIYKLIYHTYNDKAITEEKVTGKTQGNILKILKENPKTTVAIMMEQLSMSDYGIRKNLKSLKEKGLIERVGSDKAGYWKVL